MKAFIDFIPLIVFFYLYKTTDPTNDKHPVLVILGRAGVDNNHILVATFGLITATLLVYGIQFFVQKYHLEKQQWFVLGMTVLFGGITLALSDDYYIRLKAVLINIAFAIGILLSSFFTKNREPIVKKLFGTFLELNTTQWRNLNRTWASLFMLMACLHGFFAFVFMGGRYWGEFTAFGDMAVIMVFMGVVFFRLRKHFKLEP